MQTKTPYTCSFCGKTSKEVGFMVDGPGTVNICEECVEICVKIIEGRKKERVMDILLQEIAYAMVKAYDETKNKGDACQKVETAYPIINKDIIHGMRAAIDAYVDMNS